MFHPLQRLTIWGAVVAMLGIVGIVAIVARITSDQAERATFGHDAYIWQRQWTTPLDRAVAASSSRVRAWRVLAAELDGRGRRARALCDAAGRGRVRRESPRRAPVGTPHVDRVDTLSERGDSRRCRFVSGP
jgi:hypothetical protein